MRISHISWNILGLGLPLIVAAVTVPELISRLGNERFGVLALAWGLIGYASALDLGIGRALTQKVSKLLGEKMFHQIPSVLTTAARITMSVGVIGFGVIVVATALGANKWVKTNNIPSAEIQISMLLLAVALPLQSMSATYRGLNEAFLNFKGISLVRVGLGVVNFGGPFLVSFLSLKLPWLVATLVLSRMFAFFVFRWLALNCLEREGLASNMGTYSPQIAKSLFAFGGWVTVSSVLSPVLVQADRFMIGALISVAAVTFYVLPYEMVVQSLILVGAISSVIFPSLSKLIHENSSQWKAYFNRWLMIVMGIMFVSCSFLAILLPYILKIWIKDNLHPESIIIGQILCLGVFANSIGSMYYALLHAQGRSDITAKIHMIELPLFLVSLYLLLQHFGVIGAACAWVGRMTFDAIALAWSVHNGSKATNTVQVNVSNVSELGL